MNATRLHRQHTLLMVLVAGNQVAYGAVLVCVLMLAWEGSMPGCVAFAVTAGWLWRRSRYYLELAEFVRQQILRAEGEQQ